MLMIDFVPKQIWSGTSCLRNMLELCDTFAANVVKRVETLPLLKRLILQVAGFRAAEKAD